MSKIQIEDLEDYLDSFHPYSGYAMACCVFHDDHSPSMSLSERGYYCKSCHAHGTLEYLYSVVSGRPFQPKEKEYNQSAYIWKKWEEKYGSVTETCRVAHAQLIGRPDLGVGLYKRGLGMDEIQKGKLGFLSGYYLFPIRGEDRKIYGGTARASSTVQTKGNRYFTSYGCELHLYAPDWDAINQSDELYVCYGTIDAWSLLMAGYPSVTGISGQEFNERNLDRFRRRIYIIPDKGEERSALHLQSRLGWRGNTLALNWMDDTKDPNDLHRKYGLDLIKEKIEEAKEKYKYD